MFVNVPMTPVGGVTLPPAAINNGGHAVAHLPAHVLSFAGSDESVYKVFPSGAVRYRPSLGLVATPILTLVGLLGDAAGAIAAPDDGGLAGALPADEAGEPPTAYGTPPPPPWPPPQAAARPATRNVRLIRAIAARDIQWCCISLLAYDVRRSIKRAHRWEVLGSREPILASALRRAVENP